MGIAVVLTALGLEYEALRRHLHRVQLHCHPAGTLFELGHLPGGAGEIAMAVTGEGNVGAAVLAERAIAMFRPQAMLCVGVAGSLRRDIALGDIVVATKVYAMHGGRVCDDRFMARPKAWYASHELEQIAKLVARAGTWTSQVPACSRHLPPTVHFKPIAAGEVVLNGHDQSMGSQLLDVPDDAVAVEMESAGIAHAAQLNRSLPALTVRGISDHANAAKDADDAAGWQQVAADHAAAFTVATLSVALGDWLLGGQLSPQPAISPAFRDRHDDDQARADERSYCPA